MGALQVSGGEGLHLLARSRNCINTSSGKSGFVPKLLSATTPNTTHHEAQIQSYLHKDVMEMSLST